MYSFSVSIVVWRVFGINTIKRVADCKSFEVYDMSLPTASSVKMESNLHKNFQFTCSKRLTINDSYKILWGSPSPRVQSSGGLRAEALASPFLCLFCLHSLCFTPGSWAKTGGCFWFPEHSGVFLGSLEVCTWSFHVFQLGPHQLRRSRSWAISYGNLFLVSLGWVRCFLQTSSLSGLTLNYHCWRCPSQALDCWKMIICPIWSSTLKKQVK